MMQNGHALKLLAVGGLLVTLAASAFPCAKVGAQGGIRLRQPFGGTKRLTAYVDHRSPDYTEDGNVVVYMGEERFDCPDCGETWTNQGPYCYDGHAGTDYSLYLEPVLAAASGEVTFRGWRGRYTGYSIRVDHGNGYETWYSHLDSFSVSLHAEVVVGRQVGISGNSGEDQPYHLHFEVHHNGDPTDPFGWRGDWSDPLHGGPAICLWADGQCSEIVVEDESDWFYKYGSGWQWDCRGNSWTMRYVSNERDGTPYTYARWRPDLPYAGPYAVFAFVPAVHATTTNAEYTVHDKDGDHTISINQLSYSDEWVYLGSYDFWDSILGYVYLNNVTGENDDTTDVCFDTVKFRQFRTYMPLALKNYP
jgi:murein DD-endopeptidase MepM/ murein hydrolase activator NlpD